MSNQIGNSSHEFESQKDGSISPQQAAKLLSQAERSKQTLPSQFPAALSSLLVICATGSFATLGFHIASYVPPTDGFDPKAAVIAALFAWIFIALIPIFLVRDAWRRGLGKRWLVYMGLWAVLWISGMLLAHTGLALVISPLFGALAGIAIGVELKAAEKAKKQELHNE